MINIKSIRETRPAPDDTVANIRYFVREILKGPVSRKRVILLARKHTMRLDQVSSFSGNHCVTE